MVFMFGLPTEIRTLVSTLLSLRVTCTPHGINHIFVQYCSRIPSEAVFECRSGEKRGTCSRIDNIIEFVLNFLFLVIKFTDFW